MKAIEKYIDALQKCDNKTKERVLRIIEILQ